MRRVAKAVKQSDLFLSIEPTFQAPDTHLLKQWLLLGPFLCAGIAGVLTCCAMASDGVSYYRLRKLREVANENPVPNKEKVTSAMQFEDAADFGVIDELLNQGLLTSDQHRRAMDLAQKEDPRVLGAISFHDRNRMRTALMLTKLTGAADGNGTRSSNNGGGGGGGGGRGGGGEGRLGSLPDESDNTDMPIPANVEYDSSSRFNT